MASPDVTGRVVLVLARPIGLGLTYWPVDSVRSPISAVLTAIREAVQMLVISGYCG